MIRTLLAALSMLLLQNAIAQAGRLDLTYGTNGISASFPQDFYLWDMAIQPDGKAAIVSMNYGIDPDYLTELIHYNTDGTRDKAFGNSAITKDNDIDVFYNPPPHITAQADGKLLVGGAYYDAGLDGIIVRFDKNGKRDSTFGVNGALILNDDAQDDKVESITVLADGKITVALISDKPSAFIKTLVLNPDGTPAGGGYKPAFLTPTFAGYFFSNPHIAAHRSGGYVASYAASRDTIAIYSTRFGEKRFKGSGSVYYNRHAVLPNDKVSFLTVRNGNASIGLLNTIGIPDSSFDGDGYLDLPDFVLNAILSEPRGKIIVLGYREDLGHGLMRLNADGTVDASFGTNGIVKSDFTGPAFVYGNRLLVAGGNRIAAYLLSTDARQVKVNLYGNTNPFQNQEWNNWNNIKNRHFNNFYYADSTFSSISAVMSYRNGVNDNDITYGSGMAPKGVLRHSSYAIGSRTITFSGLGTSRRYSFEFYASRDAYPDDSTIFTLQGVSKKIGTYRNFTTKAVFTGLVPNSQGQIVLTISGTKMYNYLNGFTITESIAPASSQTVTSTKAQLQKETIFESGNLQLTMSPNPSAGLFGLQWQSQSNAPVLLRIVDATGRLVERRQISNGNTTRFLGQGYKSGVYYLEATQGTNHKTLKFVKN